MTAPKTPVIGHVTPLPGNGEPATGRRCYQDPECIGVARCGLHDTPPDWHSEIPGWTGRAGWVCPDREVNDVFGEAPPLVTVESEPATPAAPLPGKGEPIKHTDDGAWEAVRRHVPKTVVARAPDAAPTPPALPADSLFSLASARALLARSEGWRDAADELWVELREACDEVERLMVEVNRVNVERGRLINKNIDEGHELRVRCEDEVERHEATRGAAKRLTKERDALAAEVARLRTVIENELPEVPRLTEESAPAGPIERVAYAGELLRAREEIGTWRAPIDDAPHENSMTARVYVAGAVWERMKWDLEKHGDEIDNLRAQLKAETAEHIACAEELRATNARLDAITDERNEWQMMARARLETIAKAERQVEELTADIAAQEKRTGALGRDYMVNREKIRRLKARIAELEAAAEALAAERDDLVEERDGLTLRLGAMVDAGRRKGGAR